MREEVNCPKNREKKKGMVAFDLDHTLLDHKKGAITPSSLEAIERLKENGYLVVLASGTPKGKWLSCGAGFRQKYV